MLTPKRWKGLKPEMYLPDCSVSRERVGQRGRWTRIRLTPDNHSEVEPPLPIPNRVVKRFSADDSADSCAKVGHCQAPTKANALSPLEVGHLLLGCAKQAPTFGATKTRSSVDRVVAAQANFSRDRRDKLRHAVPAGAKVGHRR